MVPDLAVVRFNVRLEQPEDFWAKSYLVLLAEFKTTVNEYLLSSPADLPVANLDELIGFNRTSKREMQLFDQSIFEKSAATEGMAAMGGSTLGDV